ncbi:MAG: hypothetical protein DA328_05745 [Nitrososphaeraceae archaeon]|nr:hypothetical protein [Nitrososphaeraceae archaeon]
MNKQLLVYISISIGLSIISLNNSYSQLNETSDVNNTNPYIIGEPGIGSASELKQIIGDSQFEENNNNVTSSGNLTTISLSVNQTSPENQTDFNNENETKKSKDLLKAEKNENKSNDLISEIKKTIEKIL